MAAGRAGHFELSLPGNFEGKRYAFSLDGGPPRPDPASRFQPDGVHGPSQVVNLGNFPWSDHDWHGIARQSLVIYELHVGTFTAEGTFDAAIGRLSDLKELGITAIEIMPVAQFPGRRNWGYDGVGLFAAQSSYGGPRGLQRLVDAAHAVGLAVILDVVYNHFGPEGNYLSEFGPYFTAHHPTPWGPAVNFDGEDSGPVRDFVLNNVRMWIRDFHLDGLRLDAIQAIHDAGPRHILTDIKLAADKAAGAGRQVHIIAESGLNDTRIMLPAEIGGNNLDAQWSDDFHHALHTLLTGERKGYYADYDGSHDQLAKSLQHAFVHDGSFENSRGRRHGAPIGDMSADRFVIYLQNHDQVGNRAAGNRLSTQLDFQKQKLAAAILLLSPFIPLLFMGEEYGEDRPFPFFCDFGDSRLQQSVRRGRLREFAEFGWKRREIPDPQDPRTFEAAVLSWDWRDSQRAMVRHLYQTLLRCRQMWPELRHTDRKSWTASAVGTEGLFVQTRGRRDEAGDCIVAHFNLSDRPQTISSDIPGQTCLLSSADFEISRRCESPAVMSEIGPWGFRVIRQYCEGRTV